MFSSENRLNSFISIIRRRKEMTLSDEMGSFREKCEERRIKREQEKERKIMYVLCVI